MSSMKIRQKVLSEMERDGRLTATRLVEVASDTNHPMHSDFTWDNEVAGPLYRIDQARKIIQSVRVVVTNEVHRITSVAYVRDPSAEPHQQGYISTVHLQTDEDLARDAVLNEANRIQSSVERAWQFATAIGLQGELEGILQAIVGLRDAASRTTAAPDLQPSVN